MSQAPHSAAREEAESLFSAPPLTPDDVVNAETWPDDAAKEPTPKVMRFRKKAESVA